MIYRRFYRTTAIAVVALSVAGCFNFDEDIKVSDDGTSSITMKIAIDAALAAMSSDDKKSNTFCQKDAVLPTFSREGITAKISSSTDHGDIVCTITATGPTDKIFGMMTDGDLLKNENGKATDSMQTTVKKDGDNWDLNINLPPNTGSEGFDESNPFASAALAAMSGRYLSWSLTAPQILETSGELSDDKKTASFSIPLVTVATNKTETYSFHVVFKDHNASFLDQLKAYFD